MKRVVILNGFPRCGKDTFANTIIERGKEYGVNCYSISTVDLVKDMLELAGIDRNRKTPEERKLMSDLKDLLSAHDNIPFKDVVNKINYLYDGNLSDSVYFVMSREPEEIQMFKDFYKDECVTVLIIRETCDRQSNHADMNVNNFEYDVYVNNNDTEEMFIAYAQHFFDTLFEN